MKFIYMHCDTLIAMVDPKPGESLLKNSKSVDFLRMKEGGAMAQIFAMFLLVEGGFPERGLTYMTDDEYIEKLIAKTKEDVAANPDIIAMAYSAKDIIENDKNGKMSAILAIEDGRSVKADMNKIKHYHDMGVRLITLTWNYYNCFGAPNSANKTIMEDGLTAFGKEAIQYMQELGVLIDVSHLSDGGFWDIINLTKKPFVASHSNCRALSAHPRNLTDEMIKALANAGGCTGLNFYPAFLDEDTTATVSTVDLLVKHALHMKNVGGIDVVALGSDLDGITGEIEVEDISKMPMLIDGFRKGGFSEDEIEKICYKNVLRVMKDAIG